MNGTPTRPAEAAAALTTAIMKTTEVIIMPGRSAVAQGEYAVWVGLLALIPLALLLFTGL